MTAAGLKAAVGLATKVGHERSAHVDATAFDRLVDQVRACRACVDDLPCAPRPVFQVSSTAKLLIASQAPGTRVQVSGIPFSDDSGDRLREWTGITSGLFYDPMRVAILPMGFCYPGKMRGGDAPPRTECAKLWRSGLLTGMPSLRLTLLVGTYAQIDALGPGKMIDRVRRFRDYLPAVFPLPHPSWRSRLWAQKNPWFEDEVLPELRRAVQRAIAL